MINTTTATMTELRAFTTANDITIAGDKRLKASYQSAINVYQAVEAFDADAALYVADDTTTTTYNPWEEDDAIETTAGDSDRTILSAALPLILLLAVALKLALWMLDNSIVVINHIVNHTVVGRAVKGWLARFMIDASQFTNGLLYGI
jgi:hypothetical protein